MHVCVRERGSESVQKEAESLWVLWNKGFIIGISKCQSLSHVKLFVTSWTVAHQVPLSMRFSRQEYQSGLPFPSPGIFPTQGSNLGHLHCRQILHHLSHQGNPIIGIGPYITQDTGEARVFFIFFNFLNGLWKIKEKSDPGLLKR